MVMTDAEALEIILALARVTIHEARTDELQDAIDRVQDLKLMLERLSQRNEALEARIEVLESNSEG